MTASDRDYDRVRVLSQQGFTDAEFDALCGSVGPLYFAGEHVNNTVRCCARSTAVDGGCLTLSGVPCSTKVRRMVRF